MEKFIDVLTFYAIFKAIDFTVSVTVKTALRIKSERDFRRGNRFHGLRFEGSE